VRQDLAAKRLKIGIFFAIQAFIADLEQRPPGAVEGLQPRADVGPDGGFERLVLTALPLPERHDGYFGWAFHGGERPRQPAVVN
jgi:hypothetical protein